jgi:hypothetical protein
MNPIHTALSITICDGAADARTKGFDYAAAPEGVYKPVEVEQVVVVRKGTQLGLPTVDFIVKDATGQRFVFMVTGRLLKSIPC